MSNADLLSAYESRSGALCRSGGGCTPRAKIAQLPRKLRRERVDTFSDCLNLIPTSIYHKSRIQSLSIHVFKDDGDARRRRSRSRHTMPLGSSRKSFRIPHPLPRGFAHPSSLNTTAPCIHYRCLDFDPNAEEKVCSPPSNPDSCGNNSRNGVTWLRKQLCRRA